MYMYKTINIYSLQPRDIGTEVRNRHACSDNEVKVKAIVMHMCMSSMSHVIVTAHVHEQHESRDSNRTCA